MFTHFPPGSPTSFRIKRYTTSVHIMKRSKQHTPMFTSGFATCIERYNNCDLFSNLQGVHISCRQITQQTRETSQPGSAGSTPTSRPPLPLPQHNIPVPSCSPTPSTRSANNWFPSPPAQHNVPLQVVPRLLQLNMMSRYQTIPAKLLPPQVTTRSPRSPMVVSSSMLHVLQTILMSLTEDCPSPQCLDYATP